MIPKIIHQTAPDTWKNEVWSRCQATWKVHFPEGEYEHRQWSDAESRALVAQHYPWFLGVYDDYPLEILRVDMARVFMLHRYGGLYVDMDYECVCNFYDQLPSDKVSVVESPHKHNEQHQNSLMSSPAGHPFWIEYAIRAKRAYETRNRIGHALQLYSVLEMTGPVMLDGAIAETSLQIHVLPKEQYFVAGSQYARHWGTKSWTAPRPWIFISSVLVLGVLLIAYGVHRSRKRRLSVK